MQEAGIKVEYVKKGEVVLNGKRYSPLYFENTMRYEPIGKGGGNVVLTGHNIQPLIDYLRSSQIYFMLPPPPSSSYGAGTLL